MHTDRVSASGGRYFKKEMHLPGGGKLEAGCQRLSSGRTPLSGRSRSWDRRKLRSAWLPAVTSNAGASPQSCFSPSISPARISWPGVGGLAGVSCGEALPEPALRQTSSCYSDVQRNKAKRSGESVAARDRGEGKGERERRSSRRREAEW